MHAMNPLLIFPKSIKWFPQINFRQMTWKSLACKKIYSSSNAICHMYMVAGKFNYVVARFAILDWNSNFEPYTGIYKENNNWSDINISTQTVSFEIKSYED